MRRRSPKLPLYLLDEDDLKHELVLFVLENAGDAHRFTERYLRVVKRSVQTDAFRKQRGEGHLFLRGLLEAKIEPKNRDEELEDAKWLFDELIGRVHGSDQLSNANYLSAMALLEVAMAYPEESPKEWGARLGISENAVHKRVERIRAAIGLSRRGRPE